MKMYDERSTKIRERLQTQNFLGIKQEKKISTKMLNESNLIDIEMQPKSVVPQTAPRLEEEPVEQHHDEHSKMIPNKKKKDDDEKDDEDGSKKSGEEEEGKGKDILQEIYESNTCRLALLILIYVIVFFAGAMLTFYLYKTFFYVAPAADTE